jgi:hypothetical protein
MAAMVVVPYTDQGYHYVILRPGHLSSSWPSSQIVSSDAVVLELEPAYWVEQGPDFVLTYHQDWPRDVARYAARTGTEVSFRGDGVPVVGRSVTELRPDMFWHHLTLAFLRQSHSLSRLAAWEQFRAALLRDLNPGVWGAPTECVGVLHVTEGEYLVFVSPDAELFIAWLAEQLAHIFLARGGPAEQGREPFRAAAKWIMRAANERGLRLSRVEIVRSGSGANLCLQGRFGRGRTTLIRAGTETGDAFAIELPILERPYT